MPAGCIIEHSMAKMLDESAERKGAFGFGDISSY